MYCLTSASRKVICLHDVEPSHVIVKEDELPLVIKRLVFMSICEILNGWRWEWFLWRNLYIHGEACNTRDYSGFATSTEPEDQKPKGLTEAPAVGLICQTKAGLQGWLVSVSRVLTGKATLTLLPSCLSLYLSTFSTWSKEFLFHVHLTGIHLPS
jgi:hypothetical protein